MKNKETATASTAFRKELAKLQKENSTLISQLEKAKSDKKELQKDLRKERKKKDVTTITLSKEQEQLLSTLLPDIDIRKLL